MNLVGKTLGSYQILQEAGRGGMAVVYRAFQPSLGREVAIKVLPPQFTFDRQFVVRFHQEAHAAASLQHPNIVAIHDVGQEGDIHYIVMEYLRGQTLRQLIQQQGRLPPSRVSHLVDQIASALDYAHQRGFVHRDVKPDNIFVGEGDHVTLTDFGIARAASGTRVTRTGVALGTPEYMSPEQADGRPVDHRTDLYALGVVLYQMLTGQVPFRGTTPHAVLHSVIYDPPPPARRLNPQLSPAVESVVAKALAKRRVDRFQTGHALAEALRQAQAAGVVVKVPHPAGPASRPVPPGRRASQPLVLAVGFAALILVAGVVLLALLTTRPGPAPTSTILATAETPSAPGSEARTAAAWVTASAMAPAQATLGLQRTQVALGIKQTAAEASQAAVAATQRALGATQTAAAFPTATFTPPPPVTATATLAPTARNTSGPTPIPSPVVTLVPTQAPQPTSRPTEPAPVPTQEPTAVVMHLPAPTPLGPPDNQTFSDRDQVLLKWAPVDQLPADGLYVVKLSYSHLGATWNDESPWTKETQWDMSEYDFLPHLSDDGRFQWTVQVMLRTGQDAEGEPTGAPLSPASGARTLIWQSAGDDGGGPTVAPP